MKYIKLIIPLLILTPSLYSCDASKDVEVIILAGQSNMEGFDAPHSSIDEATKEYYLSNHDNVKISYDCYYMYHHQLSSQPNSSFGKFVNVQFGQGHDIKTFGPEIGLAKYLGLNSPNKNYYLIKSAEGGTNLRIDWSNEGYCYNTLISDIDESLKTLKSKNINPKIKYMIWMQGETDSRYSDITKEEYLNNSKKLINRITTKFSRYINKNSFKFIDSGITTDGVWPKADIINSAKQELVNSNPNYRYVKLSETLSKINAYHYTQESYLKLGEEYGKYVLI